MSPITNPNSSPALDAIDPTTKTQVLLEAAPYIQRFKGSIFVVKYGGSFMDAPEPELRASVATDIAFLAAVGIHVVVVHGGGKRITRALTEAGVESRFEQGLRVTTARAIEVVRKTLSSEVNLDICTILQNLGGRPLGIPGERIFRCRKRELSVQGRPVDLGFVGDVSSVETHSLRRALSEGYTPIVSPLAADAEGQPYNVNADEAAAHAAIALRARRLVFMSDVPGLMRDPADPASLISSLKVSEVDALKANGTIAAGMLPKVDSAVQAIDTGVHRVHFIDGRLPHSLLLEIFTDKGIGTEIVSQ